MAKAQQHIFLVHCSMIALLCGCESFPSTDGMWTGYIVPVRLHDPYLSYNVACLRIVEGTSLEKEYQSVLGYAPPPEGPVLVDSKDTLLKVPNMRADQLVRVQGVYVAPGAVAGPGGPASWCKPYKYGWGDTSLRVLVITKITDAQGNPIQIERLLPTDATRLIPFTTQPAPP